LRGVKIAVGVAKGRTFVKEGGKIGRRISGGAPDPEMRSKKHS